MVINKSLTIQKDDEIAFNNNADFCIGTGRMGLALQKEYFEELKFVQDKIGFKHIRGHGLFCDDMSIYHEYENEFGEKCVEYNFTYLDMVMDSYRSLGLCPFLELGFMPEKLASDTQTVFYWKGNVTPPKSYEAWTKLVIATLQHLIERYGSEEAVKFPIEVWNEPNLTVFWKDSDMNEYFRLFKTTFLAIKEFEPRFKVGGPAVCGGTDAVWIRSFLEFCSENGLKIDFVTRHFYTSMPPEKIGRYDYVKLPDPHEALKELKATRELIDSFKEYKGLKIHVTEFNTSYTPKAPVHDTNFNAAYIASLLSELGDCNESYSYWTFGDIFEEQGVPFTPFHGGFGLVANGVIPKPTFYTFEFFKKLQGKCVLRSENSVIVKKTDGSFYGVAWNLQKTSERNELSLSFKLQKEFGDYVILEKTVDEDSCNPLKMWHDMGEPKNLSREQLADLKEEAVPNVKSERFTAENGSLEFQINLKPNAVISFKINSAEIKSDRGYSYEKVMDLCKIFED